MAVQVHVKVSSGSKLTIDVELSVSVKELKDTLAAADKANIPAPQQRLIYKGHVLKDDKTLESYGARARAITPTPDPPPGLSYISFRSSAQKKKVRFTRLYAYDTTFVNSPACTY